MKTDAAHEAKREAFDRACSQMAQVHDATRGSPMITQQTIREFYEAQGQLAALKAQLKDAEELTTKLEGALLASLEDGQKTQRGRLALAMKETERRNVAWQKECEKLLGKNGVEAIRAGTAPTIYTHVVVVLST